MLAVDNIGIRKKLRKNIIEIITLILLVSKLTFLLINSPAIGMADNGDYFRILSPFGMVHIEENPNYFSEFSQYYKFDYNRVNPESFVTTQSYIINIAIFTGRLLGFGNIFDIRIVGILYSIIFISACLIFLRLFDDIYTKIAISAFILVVLSDIRYIAYFNSFYGEPLSFVFFFLLIALFLKIILNNSNVSVVSYMLISIPLIFFVGAKQQNTPLIVFFIIYIFRIIYIKKDDLAKKIILCLSILISLIVSFNVFTSISHEIRNINNFHAITLGILKDSATPKKDLEFFGIDTKYANLQNTTYFEEVTSANLKSREMEKEFFEKINTKKILFFYLENPGRIVQMVKKCINSGFEISPDSLIYSADKNVISERAKKNLFGFWGRIKLNIFPINITLMIFLYLLFYIITIIMHIKEPSINKKLVIELLWLISIVGLVQIPIAFMGAGEADLSKHLFIFNASFDLLIGSLAIYLSSLPIKSFNILRDKSTYGIDFPIETKKYLRVIPTSLKDNIFKKSQNKKIDL